MKAIFRMLLACIVLMVNTAVADTDQGVSVSFYRAFDPMTVSHNVKLKIDKKEVTRLFHNEEFQIALSPGKHVFQTSVGLSLGVPNVTGFNGARKFKKKFDLEAGEHFFKVDFKPALMGGRHEIVALTKEEYTVLQGRGSAEGKE